MSRVFVETYKVWADTTSFDKIGIGAYYIRQFIGEEVICIKTGEETYFDLQSREMALFVDKQAPIVLLEATLFAKPKFIAEKPIGK